MRILIINYEFPPLGGGAGNVSAYIARHTVARGAEVVVLTAHYKGLPRYEVIDGYQIHRVPALRRSVYRCTVPEMFSFVANSIIPSWRLARQFKPDLIHIHSGFPTGPLGYWLKLTQRIPYLMTLHGAEVPGFLPEEIGTLQNLLAPATNVVWQAASAVIAVSEGLRDLSLKSMPDVKIGVIPNGVDCTHFAPASQPKPATNEKQQLLFVGRVVAQKGLTYLLQALAQLKAAGVTNWHFNIVGDGPLRPDLETEAINLGIADQVTFTGWLPFEQVPETMRGADMFVLPSVIEGMPLVLLQAMACGLPVLATKVSGSVDLVQPGRNGWLAEACQPDSLANALQDALTQPEQLPAMGKQSRKIALTMDWQEIAKDYYTLYEAVLNRVEAESSVWV